MRNYGKTDVTERREIHACAVDLLNTQHVAELTIRQSIFCPAARRTMARKHTGGWSAATVGKRCLGQSRCTGARLWGLNDVRSRGQRGEAGRSATDGGTRVETTRVRDTHWRPVRGCRAVHRRCDQPRRTRRPGLGPVECGNGAAMFHAGDHHDVSGFTNAAREAGNSRSMMIISP